MKNTFKRYFLDHLYLCLNKTFIIDLFSETEYDVYKITNNKIDFSDFSEEDKVNLLFNENIIYKGKLIQSQKNKLYYINNIKNDIISVKKILDKIKDQPFLNVYDKITITQKDINLPLGDKNNILTTYGKLILNYTLLINPFKDNIDKFSYTNDTPWNLNNLKDQIITLLVNKDITVNQTYIFFRNLDFIAIYADLFVPSVNEQLLTIDPKVIELKKKLFKKYENKLDDQNIRIKIQSELIDLDKKIQLENPETRLFADNKTFQIHRAKMFINFGNVEKLGTEKTELAFIKDDLDHGLSKENLPAVFNEVRLGISGRALNSAKGGSATKEIARFLNDTSITELDCGTKRTISINVTELNKETLLYRNIIDNNKLITLNKKNIDKYVGKKIHLRSPLLCETKNGFCYKCTSYIWELKELDVLNVVPVSISSAIMMTSMKKMHGVSYSSITLDSLNGFIF